MFWAGALLAGLRDDMKNKLMLCGFVFYFFTAALFAEEIALAAPVYKTIIDIEDPVTLIGTGLGELLVLFGPPENVYAVRGVEEWQDDVVFEYNNIDFYLFRNRVWQITAPKINNISIGDPKAVIELVYGDKLHDKGTYIITEIPNRAWKIETRYNIDANGKITAIYIYRTDY
jgi:hypothetical protein